MELRKSKFTFQTWKDKKIPKPKGLDSWNDNPLMNKNEYDFYTLNHWSNRGLLSDSEHQKIKSEKRKAYYKALKLNVQIELDAFMEDCGHTPPEEMNDVIRLEMELTERKLTNHRMIQAIKQGKDASHLINPGLYNEIQNEKYVFISFSFFEAHQSYEYLQMLKKLEQKSDNAHDLKENDKSNLLKEKAISLTVEKVQKKKLCRKVLKRYISLDEPGRSTGKIWSEHLCGEFVELHRSRFYEWVGMYDIILKKLEE